MIQKNTYDTTRRVRGVAILPQPDNDLEANRRNLLILAGLVAILPQPDNDLEGGKWHSRGARRPVAILPQPDNDLEAIPKNFEAQRAIRRNPALAGQ